MIAAYTGWMWVRKYTSDTEKFRSEFEQSVKELSYIGYEALENWTFLADHFTAQEVKALCDSYGVRMVALYANLDEGIDSLKASVEYVRDMGGSYLVCASPNWPASVGLDSPVDRQEIKREAELLNAVGEYGKNCGVTVLHNPHSYTPVSRREETDLLMAWTNPEYVSLCVDAGHSVVSGVDAVQLVKDYADRVAYIHIKDLDPDLSYRGRGMNWVPLGFGTVRLQTFVRTLREIGYDGVVCAGLPLGCEWINTFESARLAREYLKNACGF